MDNPADMSFAERYSDRSRDTMKGWQLHTHVTLSCGRCGYTKREDTEIDSEGDYYRPDIPADWREVAVTDPSTQETWSYQFCPTCSFELSEFIKDGMPSGGEAR